MDTCRIVFFASRNKDNKDVPNFKERRETHLMRGVPADYIMDFVAFCDKGVKGEMCRMYVSVNERNLDKAKKKLMTKLINEDDFDLVRIEAKTVSCAMQSDCAAEHRWLFDFDSLDEELLKQFQADLNKYTVYDTYRTPNGYALIAGHGFDCRKLIEKYKEVVTLKRDDFLCYRWAITS